jgi:hypothetical protein
VLRLSLDEHDFFRGGEMHVGQVFEHLRAIDGGVAVGHLDAPPPLQRRKDHEEVGDAVALAFIIAPSGLSRFLRDRGAGLDDQLLRRLVQTHERTIETSRPLVGLPIAVRFEGVFLRVRPIVLSLAFSTMLNSTTFSSRRRRVQRANPSGAGEHARAISFASAAPSKIRGRAELRLYFALQRRLEPSSTSC